MFSIKNILASWQTSLMGLPLVLTSLSKVIEILLSGAPWYAIFGAQEFKDLVIGIGLMLAKDAGKTNAGNPVPVAQPAPVPPK